MRIIITLILAAGLAWGQLPIELMGGKRGLTRQGMTMGYDLRAPNLLTYSSDFSNSAWHVVPAFGNWSRSTATATTITAIASPSNRAQRITAQTGTVYTFSVELKGGTETDVILLLAYGMNGSYVGNSAGTAVTVTGNYVRYSTTGTTPASGINQIEVLIQSQHSGSTLLAQNAQVNVGLTATTYVATGDQQTVVSMVPGSGSILRGTNDGIATDDPALRHTGWYFDGVNDREFGVGKGAVWTVINCSDAHCFGSDSAGGSYVDGIPVVGGEEWALWTPGAYTGVLSYYISYSRVLTRKEHQQTYQYLRDAINAVGGTLPQVGDPDYHAYYIDQVNGSDSNSGRTAALAFKTVAKWAEHTQITGESVCLVAGSHWREQLTATIARVSPVSCGTGARPILDASDVIATGDWSKTAGRTNVYQATKAVVVTGTSNFLNTFEDDAFLTRVADAATCDSTAGSYAISEENASPVTIYIHPTGSGNPATNSKVYEYTARAAGVYAPSLAGITVRGIHTRRNAYFDGSIFVGESALVEDCLIEDGSKHNLYLASGTVRNSTVRNAYYGGSYFTLTVAYAADATGKSVLFENVNASLESYFLSSSAFFGHAGAGSYSSVIFRNCTSTNAGAGFNFGEADYVHIIDSTVTGAYKGVDVGAAVFLVQNVDISAISAGVNFSEADATLTLTGSTIALTGETASAVASVDVAGSTVVMTDNTITANPGWVVLMTGTTPNLTSLRNTFPATATGYYDLATGYTLLSDYNTFATAAKGAELGGTVYTTLATYRAATGQDAHSTPAP